MSEQPSYPAAFKAVFAKAAADADFRTECLADAAAAARKIGVVLPDGVSFTEGAPSPGVIALPPFGSDPDEIQDEQLLADVAGGLINGQDSSYTNPVYGGPECAHNP